LDTIPEAINRTYNRPRASDLEDGDLFLANDLNAISFSKIEKQRRNLEDEIKERKQRKRKIENAIKKVNLQKKLMGKGPVKKIVKKDPTLSLNGFELGQIAEPIKKQRPVFKWKRVRKR